MISIVSAFEFDNTYEYNPTSKTAYIHNCDFWIGTCWSKGEVLAEATLTWGDTYVGVGEDVHVGTFLYTPMTENAEIQDLDLINMKNGKTMTRGKQYKVKEVKSETYDDFVFKCSDVFDSKTNNMTEECEMVWTKDLVREVTEWKPITNPHFEFVVGETYEIGVFVDVEDKDHGDWRPTFSGVEIPEWSEWTADLNANLELYWDCNSSDNLLGNSSMDFQANEGTMNYTTNGALIGKSCRFTTGNNLWIAESDYTNIRDNLGTWNFWVKIDDVSTAEDYIWSNYADWDYNQQWHNGNYMYSTGFIAGTGAIGGASSNNQWIMLTYLHNSTGGYIYKNGTTLLASGSITATNLGNDKYKIGTTNTNANDLVGYLDEIAFWSRPLTYSEIQQLYNSGSGITISLDNAPVITGELPANNTVYTTTTTVNFNATVSDDVNLENVSLKIDGVIDQTNSSGYNNTLYSFSKSLSAGMHNWSLIAWDNESQSTETDTKWVNISIIPPTIVLSYPADHLTVENATQNIYAYVYDNIAVANVSLYIDGVLNETNSSGLNATNYTFTKTFEDGSYDWYIKASDNQGFVTDSATRTLNVNTTPFIEFITPTQANNSLDNEVWVYAKVNLTETYFSNLTLNIYNSSGLVNSTTYTDSTREINWTGLPSGIYVYDATVWTNTLQTNSTESRYIILDTTSPLINLTAPESVYNLLKAEDILNLNWTVTDSSLDSCYYVYNNSIVTFTNTTNNDWFDGDWSTFTDYRPQGYLSNITIYTNETELDLIVKYSLFIGSQTETFTLTEKDKVGNAFYLEIFGNQSAIATQIYSYNSTGRYLKSAGDRGIYEIGLDGGPTLSDIGPIIVNCSSNHTNFSYIPNLNNITFYANDTYGNVGSEVKSWTYKILENSLTYSPSTKSGLQEDYELNITLGSGVVLSSATLHYDDEEEVASIYSSGQNRRILIEDFTVPSFVSDTNVSFYFTLELGDSTEVNSTSGTQLVQAVLLDNCSNYTNVLYNISLFDEETLLPLYGDIQITYDLLSGVSFEEIATANLSLTNVSQFQVCSNFNVSGENFLQSAQIRYVSTDYAPELYHIQRAELVEGGINLSLYDLNSSSSTEFKITYQNDDFILVEGAVLQLLRGYIEEDIYRVVEAPLTSRDGTALVHVDLDTIPYKAILVKNGEVLDVFDNLVFKCQSELTGECEQKLLGEIDPQNDQSLEDLNDLSYTITEENNTITVTFSIPSGVPSNVNIVMEQKDTFGIKTICNESIISSAGSLDCSYSDTIGDSYIVFELFKNDDPIAIQTYIVPEEGTLDFLGNNFIIVLVFLLSLVGMAMASPEWMIVNGIITLVISGSIWLVSGLNFVIGLGGLLWLVVAAGILIFKLSKQEDR